ncbi:hypothetical protein [Longimicrobium sp.]|uniref:hypothetical protein n=1 Tax=Longimicrobium sp. TaxID=2029185 RepID=UPI002D078821|nr:hypothetical protein [Longimicrobium sp.]HSU15717.1 hypothetical protein [Longimicrobium sp.]
MSEPMNLRDDDELSVDELDTVAGGVEGDNTNCTQACTSNTNCSGGCSAQAL